MKQFYEEVTKLTKNCTKSGALIKMTRHPVKSLYVFDIDDTLFRTSARARVVNTKGQVKYLSSKELKDYEFSASEKICFSEFTDARKFAEESIPRAAIEALWLYDDFFLFLWISYIDDC